MIFKSCIDLNCDLGEGFPHDKELFPLISSANIACGGHAGDKNSIIQCLDYCQKFMVAAGAHPSYPDKENFGRVSLAISSGKLKDSLRKQMELFIETAEGKNIPVHHVKLHGALYNDCAFNKDLADQVLEILTEYSIPFFYGPSGSPFNRIAKEKGFKSIDEVFADRAYLPNGRLAPRSMAGAVLNNIDKVINQLTSILTMNRVIAIDGATIPLQAGTICLHGDTPGASLLIKEIRDFINKLEIKIAAS